MSPAIVMKFGGTSVADANRLRGVAALASERAADGVLLVLSAFSGVTDSLFGMGKAAVSGDEAGALSLLEAMLTRHRVVAEELLFGPRGPGAREGAAAPLASPNAPATPAASDASAGALAAPGIRRLPESVEAALEAARSELGAILRGASLLRALPERSHDVLAGRGELLSTAILAAYMGVPWIDARKVLRTDSRFGTAKPLGEEIRVLAAKEILPLLGPGKIAVTQGYIGSDASGAPTTLGRGGSDYSASLLGAAIDAKEIQIWTDVEGVLSCDPRVVPEARPVEVLGYDEAAELAAFGAKVLHPATILPAVERGIPVTVRNSLLPGGRFTTISRESASGRPVTALASRGPVTVVTVRTPRMLGGSGFLARIFEAYGRRGVSVDLVATSEVSVSATIEASAPVDELAADLAAFGEVRIERDRAVVALVGERLLKTPGVAGKAFSALGDINIEMISLGANEINLSLVVPKADAAEAQRRLHAAFFGRGGEES